MRNSDVAVQKQKQKQLGGGGGIVPPPITRNNNSSSIIHGSFRAISSYLRIVSSGASTVARSAVSAASSIVDRDTVDAIHDQVLWAGFDKLEREENITRRVLLLGFRSGFQVWDVEEADNVRDLVSRNDGPVSFMQMLPKPIASKRSEDKFTDSRPLLVLCSNRSLSGACTVQDGLSAPCNRSMPNWHDPGNGSSLPTMIRFYSLRSHSFVHTLKFRSVVYSVRCSSRVIAIAQAAQIHCFNSSTLEREYTILTNPVVTGCPGSGAVGYGPLAVGPRWLAYSGSPLAVSNTGRISPQHLTPSGSFSGFSSNGSLVAHYAKESSKHLAAGIVTLGDMGYKKLSRYYSEFLADSNHSVQAGNPSWKGNGAINDTISDVDNIGMVVVRDIVSKDDIAQFRAHKSPISALCFDPSGTLLVTASVQGHNINVFKIMPGVLGSSSYVHLYRLQRGFTNAVIQDISFSYDSNWVMISSSRGTSHLFAINPWGGPVNFQAADASRSSTSMGDTTKPAAHWPSNLGLQRSDQKRHYVPEPPVTLSVVSRIRNGSNGWSGAAAAATGRTSSVSGTIAATFHNCKGDRGSYSDSSSSKAKCHLLVFSPTGSMVQYALQMSARLDSGPIVSGLGAAYESAPDNDARLVVKAIQKWNICQKQTRREREDNIDIYGENGNLDGSKIYPKGIEGNNINSEGRVTLEQEKMNSEDKYHLYISEAELQMHQTRTPLWAKPEYYFQSMSKESMKTDQDDAFLGEIEIERIQTRVVEARSKYFIPVFDFVQGPRLQQANQRILSVDSNTNGRLRDQRPELSENGSFSRMSSSGSLYSVLESSAAEAEPLNGRSQMPMEANACEYKHESSEGKDQLQFVNNSNEGLKSKNHSEDGDDLFH